MKLRNCCIHMGFISVILLLLFAMGIGTNIFTSIQRARAATVSGKSHTMSLRPQYRLVGTAEPRSPRLRRFDCQDAAAAQR